MTVVHITECVEMVEVDSSVIIHAPHGSRIIPPWDRSSLLIGDEELRSELLAMTDSHTADIARSLSLGTSTGRSERGNDRMSSLYLNRLSRLVFDPERFPDEREEMNSVGMGFRYTHGSQRQRIRKFDDPNAKVVLDTLFKPYAAGLTDLTRRTMEVQGRALIVDIHSYASRALPYEIHQDDDRPEICVGVDSFHTQGWVANSVIGTLSDVHGYQVNVNQPFSGTYVPLDFYGVDDRVQSVMLEIRRDMYMDEASGNAIPKKMDRLMSALEDVLDVLYWEDPSAGHNAPTDPLDLVTGG